MLVPLGLLAVGQTASPTRAGAGCTPGFVGCAASPSCCGVLACPGQPTVPTCRECTSASDCSGNAVDPIPGDGYRCQCESRCRNSWTGRDCSLCSAPRGGTDCDGCVAGMVGCTGTTCPKVASPTCRTCSSADCYNHASAITSDGYQCQCTCRNAWQGVDVNGRVTCGLCPPPYGHGPANDCDACAFGYKLISTNASGWPTCEQCDRVKDCSGNDVPGTLTSNGLETCCCTCRNSWEGESCNMCPKEFGGSDCNECAAGTLGTYPLCYLRNVTVVGAAGGNTTVMTRRRLTSSGCGANETSVDFVVECGSEARKEASIYYQRRGLQNSNDDAEALWYYGAVDSATGCFNRRYPPTGLTLDPADSHHVEVCRVVESYGLTTEFMAANQSCVEGVNKLWTTSPTVARLDTGVNYTITSQGFAGLTSGQHFASRWYGQLNITRAGNHTFYLSSDDGSQLWIDGFLVVDTATAANKQCTAPLPVLGCQQCHLYRTASGSIPIAAGKHRVLIKHFQADAYAGARLTYSGPQTCAWQRETRTAELRPLPVFLLWELTSTQSISITPTVTPAGMGIVCTALGSTLCIEREGSYALLIAVCAGLFLVFCCVLGAVVCCCCMASSSSKASAAGAGNRHVGGGEMLEEQPPAIPDPVEEADIVQVSVKRVQSKVARVSTPQSVMAEAYGSAVFSSPGPGVAAADSWAPLPYPRHQ